MTLKCTKEELKDHVKEAYSDPKIWERLQYIKEAKEDKKTRHSIWYVGFKGQRGREIHQQNSSKNARGNNKWVKKCIKSVHDLDASYLWWCGREIKENVEVKGFSQNF